jgi:hypothetical protein
VRISTNGCEVMHGVPDRGLIGINPRWGDGPGPAVDHGDAPAGPRALIMVEIAGESHVVDVGVPALFPGDHVMRLAPVRRLIAGGETTSAVSRGEGAALGCGGDTAGPAIAEHTVGAGLNTCADAPSSSMPSRKIVSNWRNSRVMASMSGASNGSSSMTTPSPLPPNGAALKTSTCRKATS